MDDTFRHRTGEVELSVLTPDGRPAPDRTVTVAQQRHAFAFGNIGFDFVSLVGGPAPAGGEDVETFGRAGRLDLDRAGELWLNLFNTSTLPFYWGGYEPRRGTPDTARLTATARWFAERGVAVKGHPLVWHTVQPPWLLGLGLDEVERLLRARIRDLAGGFAGLIDTWDAINEAVIMPVFANGENAITPLARARGRIHMVRMAFEEARAANPAATLVLNDFDLSSAFECLIEGVLEAGVRIDAIGLQTHMHQGYRGEEYIIGVLDRFARYGLPLHMTETTLVSGNLMPSDIEDLNDYRIPEWPSTPTANRARPTTWSATTGRCSRTRRYRRSTTGDSRTTGPGSAPRAAWCAQTAPASRRTTPWSPSSRANGGCHRPACAPPRTARSPSVPSSATTPSTVSRSPSPRAARRRRSRSPDRSVAADAQRSGGELVLQ